VEVAIAVTLIAETAPCGCLGDRLALFEEAAGMPDPMRQVKGMER
jgi:hypothetical protein